jgi:[acyl-carrier-protein] S-malonyltransferase
MTVSAVALLCPGQASQYVGMGKSLAGQSKRAAGVLERAQSAAGFDLLKLIYDGPADQLSLTEFQQPCVLAVTVAAYAAISDSIENRLVCAAGHSLGEYSALVIAGSLALDDAIRLVRKRGQLMQEAVPAGQGSMAALIGRGTIDVDGLCEAASQKGDACYPANYNSEGQVVISGATAALERASKLAKKFGARKFIPLKVSAPFHSPMMKPAAERFAKELEAVSIDSPAFDVYSNVTGLPHDKDPRAIRDMLIKQIESPVLFDMIARQIAGRIPTGAAIECGPGKVLAGIFSRIPDAPPVVSFGEAKDSDTLTERGIV